MTNQHTLQQARLLFAFGQKIRNQMIKAHLDASGFITPPFGEDLSPSQTLAIMKISGMENCTITGLAEELNVSAPSASAMVDRLVEKNAVQRIRSEKDRRQVVVSLTKPAQDYADQFEQAMLQSFVQLIETIGPQLTGQWCDLVSKIEKRLNDPVQRPGTCVLFAKTTK